MVSIAGGKTRCKYSLKLFRVLSLYFPCTEGGVTGGGANSGGVASLSLDHGHGSQAVSLHTADGRRGRRHIVSLLIF